MPDYRVYFLGANGKIFASDDIRAATDDEARGLARRLTIGQASAFELWQGSRRLHTETFGPLDEPSAVRAHSAEPE